MIKEGFELRKINDWRKHRLLPCLMSLLTTISLLESHAQSPVKKPLSTPTTQQESQVGMLPEVEILPVQDITTNSFVASGNVISEGNSLVIARGVCFTQNPNQEPKIENTTKTANGSGLGLFKADVNGLTGKEFYIRAYATNKYGTSYSIMLPFVLKRNPSPKSLPLVGVGRPSLISPSKLLLEGNVLITDGLEITMRGFCYSKYQNPTINDGKIEMGSGYGDFSATLSNLLPNTTYFIKSYAINEVGIAYSQQESSFTTPASITDIDGNVYGTIPIGSQVWMIDNLKTSRYQNGDKIIPDPVIKGKVKKGSRVPSKGAFIYQDNDSSNNPLIGKLYNWYAILDSRNICPIGWHIPSSDDLNALFKYLDGNGFRNFSLEQQNPSLGRWHYWAFGGSASPWNKTGFSAVPSGGQDNASKFYKSTKPIIFWTHSLMRNNYPHIFVINSLKSSDGSPIKWAVYAIDLNYLSLGKRPDVYAFGTGSSLPCRCLKN
jgi:uncharacterized protein (TIGR02145 family)